MVTSCANSLLQEAIIKAGGTQQLLDGAVRAGRVIRSGSGGMAMYYFPRKVFSKQTVVKQGMNSLEEKTPENNEAVEKMQNDLLRDFEWDPKELISAGLDSIQQGGGMDVAPSSSITPSSSLGPPISLTSSHGAHLYLYLSSVYLPSSHWVKLVDQSENLGLSGFFEKKHEQVTLLALKKRVGFFYSVLSTYARSDRGSEEGLGDYFAGTFQGFITRGKACGSG